MKINNRLLIGIIDSGIDELVYRSHSNILSSVSVNRGDQGTYIDPALNYDRIGHGTAVFSIINNNLSETQNVDYIVVKIFDNDLLTGIDKLVHAINYCIETNCKIINISATVTHSDLELEIACKNAYKQNIYIVAANSNFGSKEVYPADYPFCYGVQSGICHGKNDYYFDKNAKLQFVTRGDAQRVTWLNKSQLFLGGASFATAHATAFIGNILLKETVNSRDELDDLLTKRSLIKKPRLVPPSYNSKTALYVDSEIMRSKANDFLTWNNVKCRSSVVLSNNKHILGCSFPVVKNVNAFDNTQYNTVIVCPDYNLYDYTEFEMYMSSQRKYVYYLLSNFRRNKQREKSTHFIIESIFDYDDMKKYVDLEEHLRNYRIKAPIFCIGSTVYNINQWNTAVRLKKLFQNDGYKAVIFDMTSNTSIFGAEASCCFSDTNCLVTDYSNYTRIISLFMKCLDYYFKPDIIIVCARLSLTKSTVYNGLCSILQSCSLLLASKMEAFVFLDSKLDDNFINNLEIVSKSKYLGTIGSDLDKIFLKIKDYFS